MSFNLSYVGYNTKIDSELEHRFDGREIRQFQVVVMRRRQRKVQKSSQSCVTFCLTGPFCFAVLVAIIFVVTLAT